MVNKQKMWFLTLFSLILVLSVYYITMPTEILTTTKNNDKKKAVEKKVSKEMDITNSDILTVLELEKDEERSALVMEYNKIITSKNSNDEEKNNAYNGLKDIDDKKAKEEEIKKSINDVLKLKSFVKVDNNKVKVVIKNKEHNYSIANKVMRLVQEKYNEKIYVSVKFEK